MRIIGIGLDLIETERISSAYQKFGKRFLNRIYGEQELTYCMGHKFFEPYLAVRFAAKEAISKAFATGIGEKLGWIDMEILRKASGQPYVVYSEKALELCKLLGVKETLISLTHAKDYAVAQAILIGD
ncbi:MAG: holo-ACP synthase [Verrucomicrobiota bacterium]|nr:holo-ACP synthase [Verrucomicrobiota bacterium]